MAIYLFLQILKFTKHSIKLIEKLSRPHLINSSDVFVIKGFTVENRNTNVKLRMMTYNSISRGEADLAIADLTISPLR